MPNYESAGLDSNLGLGSQCTAHQAVDPSYWNGQSMGTWGILGMVNCGNLDIALALSPGLMGSHSSQAQELVVWK